MILLTLLLPACAAHQIRNQRQDVASVRRVDSAWSAAYARGDTAFFRCLLTPDYRGYDRRGAESNANDEVGKAAKHGRPDAPLPSYPNGGVMIQGASAWVGGIVNGKRWIDVYRFEDGAWHAFLSVDINLPESPPAS